MADETIETKAWYLSKTLWGTIIMGVGILLNKFFGYTIDEDTQAQITDTVVENISYGINFVGAVLAIWGRITATKKVTA